MDDSRDTRLAAAATEMGYSFEGEIKIGGNYVSVVQHADLAYVSGQIPRVGDEVVVTGGVGAEVSLPQAQVAARICAMRALVLLRQHLGSLDRISQILRITVFVQSAQDFTRQSEVADAASGVLYAVLGSSGVHTRTSVGVAQLPKNASVEMDLIASVAADDSR